MGAVVGFGTVLLPSSFGVFDSHCFVHKQCQWLSPYVVDFLTFFFLLLYQPIKIREVFSKCISHQVFLSIRASVEDCKHEAMFFSRPDITSV